MLEGLEPAVQRQLGHRLADVTPDEYEGAIMITAVCVAARMRRQARRLGLPMPDARQVAESALINC